MSTMLPKEWTNTNLGSILLSIIGGGTPSKSKPEYFLGNIPWMSVKDMNKYILKDTVDHITPDAVKNSSTNIIPAGTPIIATRMSLGKIVTASFDSAINQDLKALFLPKDIDRNFFLHWYRSQSQLIESLGTGTTVKGIRLEVLNGLSINLPPLAEQKIIADKLDDLLARVESIKIRLENIPEILKKFRRSVLSTAVSGKLTEEWRCQNSTSLEDWKYLSLSNIVSNIEAGKNIKCIEVPPKDNEVGIIKISAVTWGKYDEEESKTLEDDSLFIESRRICVGDFLISRANTLELLGNPVIVHSVTRNLMLSDKVLRLIMPDEDKLWVSIFLRSSVGRKEIESRSTGNQLSMRNIGQKSLLAIPLPYPESDEKREIVKKVEAFLTYAENIENQSYDVLSKIKNLTQSIPAKAFRGELTAQWREENPELISGLNSAEALLEKITAEKLASSTVKKRAKKASH